jgi:hypothetical protein
VRNRDPDLAFSRLGWGFDRGPSQQTGVSRCRSSGSRGLTFPPSGEGRMSVRLTHLGAKTHKVGKRVGALDAPAPSHEQPQRLSCRSWRRCPPYQTSPQETGRRFPEALGAVVETQDVSLRRVPPCEIAGK